MSKYLVLKEEYIDQVLWVVIPGMGKVKLETNKIGGDKSFYITSGLGYLFEEISIREEIINEVIEDIKEEEKVEDRGDKQVKKGRGRPRKN
jgi:hypothetical protein